MAPILNKVCEFIVTSTKGLLDMYYDKFTNKDVVEHHVVDLIGARASTVSHIINSLLNMGFRMDEALTVTYDDHVNMLTMKELYDDVGKYLLAPITIKVKSSLAKPELAKPPVFVEKYPEPTRPFLSEDFGKPYKARDVCVHSYMDIQSMGDDKSLRVNILWYEDPPSEPVDPACSVAIRNEASK